MASLFYTEDMNLKSDHCRHTVYYLSKSSKSIHVTNLKELICTICNIELYVTANLSYVLCLSHVGGDGSSVPGAVGPLWTGAGRITVCVIIGVHAVVFIAPPRWLLLQVEDKEGKDMKLNWKWRQSNTRHRQKTCTHTPNLIEHKHS